MKDAKALQEMIIKPNPDFYKDEPKPVQLKDIKKFVPTPPKPESEIDNYVSPDGTYFQNDTLYKDGKPIPEERFNKSKSRFSERKKSDLEYDDFSTKGDPFGPPEFVGPPEPPKSEKKSSDDNPLSFLDDTNVKLREKGKAGAEIMAEIKSGYAKEIGTMFDGNEDSLNRTGKNLMEMMGKIIKKVLTATILEQVLAQVGSMGPYGWLFTPVIYGAIQVGLNAIVDPILKGLTSFAGGGRVDMPTLALIGDASNARSGNNTEWIMRDDQLEQVIHLAMRDFVLDLNRGFDDYNVLLTELMNKNNVDLSSSDKELAFNSEDYLTNSNMNFFDNSNPTNFLNTEEVSSYMNSSLIRFEEISTKLNKLDDVISAVNRSGVINLNGRKITEEINRENYAESSRSINVFG